MTTTTTQLINHLVKSSEVLGMEIEREYLYLALQQIGIDHLIATLGGQKFIEINYSGALAMHLYPYFELLLKSVSDQWYGTEQVSLDIITKAIDIRKEEEGDEEVLRQF